MNRKKILLVDDDQVVLKALTIKLTAQGYDVIPAWEVSVAVTAVRKEKPDLIILDLSFPPDVSSGLSDGFSIMEWLKRLDEAAKIPIIVITGGDPAKYEEKAKTTGAAAFFRKPINHDELLVSIRKILSEERAVS